MMFALAVVLELKSLVNLLMTHFHVITFVVLNQPVTPYIVPCVGDILKKMIQFAETQSQLVLILVKMGEQNYLLKNSSHVWIVTWKYVVGHVLENVI
jgi:hypothetical protein